MQLTAEIERLQSLLNEQSEQSQLTQQIEHSYQQERQQGRDLSTLSGAAPKIDWYNCFILLNWVGLVAIGFMVAWNKEF